MYFLYIKTIKSSYDFLWALLELKQKVECYDEQEFDPLAPTIKDQENLECFISKHAFDCLVSYLFIPQISEICKKYSLKYVSWVYDSPLITLYHPAAHNNCNYIFIFDKFEYEQLKKLQFPHLYYLPMGVNISRTGSLDIQKEDEEIFSCNISFIGSLYENNSYNEFITSIPEDFSNELKLYLVRNLCNWSTYKPWPEVSPAFSAFMAENFSANQWPRHSMKLELYLGLLILSRKLAEMDRITVLNTLADQFDIDIYTRSDCSHLHNVNIHSGVDYYTDMNKIFYLSKINLNITLPSIVTGLPQRIFDIMGSGGFVLTNYQAEIDDYFVVGKEIEFFHNLDELKEKSAYYLSHERQRLQIAMNGYKKVRNCFRYTQQVQKILDIIRREST